MQIKIGVLGCSSYALRKMIPAFTSRKDFLLAGIASRDEAKSSHTAGALGCRVFKSYAALVGSADVDAVYVPLPNTLHYEWAKRCLENGKHVLCEKPITPEQDTTLELVELAKAKKRVLFENFSFTYHPQLKFAEELLQRGKIGELRSMTASFAVPPFASAEDIRYNAALGGGSLLDTAVYPLKAVTHFLDRDVGLLGAGLQKNGEKNVDLAGSALYEDARGRFAHVQFGFEHYYRSSIELWGSQGRVTLQRAFTAGPEVDAKVLVESEGKSEETSFTGVNQLQLMLDDFSDAVRKGDFARDLGRIVVQAEMLARLKEAASKGRNF